MSRNADYREPVRSAARNGNPSRVWREVDRMMLETLDAKYEAQVANGDRSAVETLTSQKRKGRDCNNALMRRDGSNRN